MSTIALHPPRVRLAVQVTSRFAPPAAPVNQTSTLAFAASNVSGVDSIANLSSVGLDAATTNLALTTDLRAGQVYSFSYAWTSKGAPAISLVDGAGKVTKVNMAKGFTVPTSGTYTLKFDYAYSLKSNAGLESLQIKARATLPKSTGDKTLDAVLYVGTTDWWHDADAGVTLSDNAITDKVKELASASSRHALTYSFLSSAPAGQAATMSNFQEMTDEQKAAVRRAFDYYAKIIDVSFEETDAGTGNINFGTNSQASSAGYATVPNTSTKDQAFLYLANNQASNSGSSLNEGLYGWETILHEIGHTLGLKHPGNYNAGGGGTPGPYLSAKMDNHQYSIMSYHDNAFTTGVRSTTPELLDIAALQYLYGANDDTSTATNGKFVFDAGQTYLKTLWSKNGTDVIDLTGLLNSSHINLNAGTFSDIAFYKAPDSPSYSGYNNVSLAYGSKINNVKLSDKAGLAESVTLNTAYLEGAFNTVTNFEASADTIGLGKKQFKGVSATTIEFGTAATNAKTRLVVNNTTGEIFYTAKGNAGVAQKISQVSTKNGVALTGQNFSVVA
jgi:hypothetical protein